MCLNIGYLVHDSPQRVALAGAEMNEKDFGNAQKNHRRAEREKEFIGGCMWPCCVVNNKSKAGENNEHNAQGRSY